MARGTEPVVEPVTSTAVEPVASGGRRRRRRQGERGMTTAEYAVGTVAAVSFGGVLLRILTDPALREMIMEILLWILRTVSGVVLG